jgi:tetratricopeptide (TPR) repeat protein
VEYYRKALAARQALYVKSPDNTANRGALAECHNNLGEVLASSHPSEALENYGKAIELLEKLTVTDPNNAQYRIRLAGAVTNAARINAGFEQWSKACSLYRRSQDLWSQLERAGKLRAEDVVARELARCENF